MRRLVVRQKYWSCALLQAIETNLREWEDERRAVALETAQARRAMAGGGANDEKQNDGGGGGENAFGEAERHAKLRER